MYTSKIKLTNFLKAWLIFTSLFVFHSDVICQNSVPDSVKIGVYISSLHDFDFTDNSINADMHLWCLYNNENFNFEKELEFINSDDINFNGTSVEDLAGQKWFYTKCILKSRQKYSTRNYPFDNHKIIFSIESSEYTSEDFVFKPDVEGSKIDSLVYKQFDEWEIKNVEFSSSETKYSTSFGDLSTVSTNSPRFDITLYIERIGSWFILFKLITVVIIAFLISLCVFWIKPINIDPRFGLSIGGLFVVIGNKYIVESIIPSKNELTLIDIIHNITFIAIFIIILISVISLHIFEKKGIKNKNLSEKIDKISFSIISVGYFFTFILLIFKFS